MEILRRKRSFTLMELVVVVVVVSVLATIALTKYNKTLQCGKEREIINNLYTIYGAARAYKIKYGTYPTANMSNLATINSTLGLNIISSDATTLYQYDTVAHTFKAISPQLWEVHSHDGVTFIHCNTTAPACPTCSGDSGTGCGNIPNY